MNRVGITFALVAAGAVMLPGCTASREELSVGHRDPSVKIPGMKKAVRMHDREAVAQLVEDLDSDDPAVRFYSIEALERLTGNDLGYRYFDDEDARKPALARWQGWLKDQQQLATTRPAAKGPETAGSR